MPAQAPRLAPYLYGLVLLAIAVQAPGAYAQPHARALAAKPTAAAHEELPWAALTSEQQDALAPLKRDWPGIDAARRRKWMELANRFSTLPAPEQQRVQARMTEWAQMSPDERARARLHFQETRKLSPQERKARWDAYMALPADERRALASRRAIVPSRHDEAWPVRKSGRDELRTERTGRAGSAGSNTPKAVSPAVVQPTPGATTTLISNAPATVPPPRIGHPMKALGSTAGQVNRSTLLPRPPARAASAPPAAR